MGKNLRLLYNRGADILSVCIEDCTGRKIEKFKINIQDTSEIIRTFKYLNDKFSLRLDIRESDAIPKPLFGEIDWFKSDESFKW